MHTSDFWFACMQTEPRPTSIAGTQEGITFAISQTHYAKAFLQPRLNGGTSKTPHNDLEPLRRSNSFEGANRLLTFA